MVAGLLRRRLEASKDALAAETKEADFCKEQLTQVRGSLQRESSNVEAKLRAFREAKAEAASAMAGSVEGREQLRLASNQQVDSEMALRSAGSALAHSALPGESASELGLAALRRSSDDDDHEETPAEKDLSEAKFELRKATEGLARAEREHEILRSRCLQSAGQEQTYELRAAARDAEIGALKQAHDLLDGCGPTGC